jgi:hypothetical protein
MGEIYPPNLNESFSLEGSSFGAKRGEMEITAVKVNRCLTRG